MSRYAERTEVPPERSRAEIERTLIRYGAVEAVSETLLTLAEAVDHYRAQGDDT